MLFGIAVRSEKELYTEDVSRINSTIKPKLTASYPNLKSELLRQGEGQNMKRKGWKYIVGLQSISEGKKFLTIADMAAEDLVTDNIDACLIVGDNEYRASGYLAYEKRLETTFNISEKEANTTTMKYFLSKDSLIENREEYEKLCVLMTGSHLPLLRYYEEENLPKDVKMIYLKRIVEFAKKIGLVNLKV